MRQAFVFDKVAVLVFPWHEPMTPPERGARVEIRLLVDEGHRGSPSAAQRIVIDDPVFRADLFDQVTAPPGNLRSAHFHPRFIGVEPSDREWPEEIKTDPTGWLEARLSDLGQLLKESNVDVAGAPWVDVEAAAVRDALPSITTAVEAAWTAARSQ